MKKVYFATPVNGRKELTKQMKKEAALQRCIEVRHKLNIIHPDWIVMFSFNVCPVEDKNLTEAEAMGRCVTLLMACDALILDDGWMESAGCNVERAVAVNYNKRILTIGQAELLQAKV
jgi:hypothetical protein